MNRTLFAILAALIVVVAAGVGSSRLLFGDPS